MVPLVFFAMANEKTPIRRSPHFNVDPICLDSTHVRCARPKFNLLTPSPGWKEPNDRVTTKVVLDSSNKRDSESVPSKSKGKEKVDLPHDSDFEDEIPISKRCRLNPHSKSVNVKCKPRLLHLLNPLIANV